MFRTSSHKRTYWHNLKLASILSAVAGIVNSTGILELNILTTNLTGHFAFFAQEIILSNYTLAVAFMIYVMSFLVGAFVSSFLIEWVSKYNPHTSYIIPIVLEVLILLAIAFQDPTIELEKAMLVSSSLLFAMGLQNALVTRVSKSVVRTTHLTGLFTDLGIELSELFFHRSKAHRRALKHSVFLKLAIISSFFTGSLLGGYGYVYFGLQALLMAVGLLVFALWYDRLLSRYHVLKRKFTLGS